MLLKKDAPSLPPLPKRAEDLDIEFHSIAACYDRPTINQSDANLRKHGELQSDELFSYQYRLATGAPPSTPLHSFTRSSCSSRFGDFARRANPTTRPTRFCRGRRRSASPAWKMSRNSVGRTVPSAAVSGSPSFRERISPMIPKIRAPGSR